MNEELETVSREISRDQIEVLSWHLVVGTGGKITNNSVGKLIVTAEIRK
jgi:hypothetical protein